MRRLALCEGNLLRKGDAFEEERGGRGAGEEVEGYVPSCGLLLLEKSTRRRCKEKESRIASHNQTFL